MHVALPRPPADDDHSATAALRSVLAHLDAVYGFALTLTGSPERAFQLTESVYLSVRDGLWTTLGGHGLRDRLLARTVSVYREDFEPDLHTRSASPTRPPSSHGSLDAALADLAWDERAAVALVDRLGMSYADGSAVLGVDLAAFRSLLHRARSVLFAAYRTGAR